MIIPTDTNAYSGLSEVVQNLFDSIYPYLLLVIGVILAFFIIEMIIRILRPQDSISSDFSKNDSVTYDKDGNIKFIEFDN